MQERQIRELVERNDTRNHYPERSDLSGHGNWINLPNTTGDCRKRCRSSCDHRGSSPRTLCPRIHPLEATQETHPDGTQRRRLKVTKVIRILIIVAAIRLAFEIGAAQGERSVRKELGQIV